MTVVFHVSPSVNRESIRRHGLDWRRMAGPGIAGAEVPEVQGIFVAANEDEADWFVELSRPRHASVDVWEVTLAGEPEDTLDGYWYVREAIPVERLRLLRSDL